MTDRQRDEMAGLGANERALLGDIRFGPLRRLAVRLVRLKMRLQFTGWLQYLIPLAPTLLLVLLGAVTWLLAGPWASAVFLLLAAALLLIVAFDIVTSKFLVRLPERRPPRRDGLSAIELLRARKSCRSYQTTPLSDADRKELLAAVERELQRPPLGKAEPRLLYIRAPLTVWPVVNASEFLVAIAPEPYDRAAVIDVGRSLQRVVVDATRMGLGTCWIGPGADQRSVAKELGERFDADTEHIVCVCAVGYPSAYAPLFVRLFTQKMSATRLPLRELFFSDDALQKPLDVGATPYDRFGEAYEVCRWAPSSYNGQTTRAAVQTDDGGDVNEVKFFAVTTSRYYAPVALGIWCANWELAAEALGQEGTFELGPGPSDHLPSHDATWRPSPKTEGTKKRP